ncbi:hypothetical protein LCGC14_0345010 [marine sediment metagenome]|uniref:Portal protein n=1 Tax=marine sediment metagenome TaxID=412755 RepID=A0A0F9TCQ2_9ZZZZ
MANIEGPRDSVQKIKFTGDQKDKLRHYLQQELSVTEGERSRLLDKCKSWAKQANSRRQRTDLKARDSNIDMPLTRQRMMQNSARLLNPIFQQDVLFIAKPRNPVVEDMARAVEKLNDYISDNIPYRSLCGEWIEQFQTFPFGVVKTPFIQETERIIRWKELTGYADEETGEEFGPLDEYNIRKLDKQKVTLRKLKDKTEKYYLEVDEEVPVRVGAFPEVVPFEDFIVPMSTVDVRTADWVIHRIWMTKPTIKSRIRTKVYDKKDGDQDIMDALGEPAADRERLLTLTERRDRDLELDDTAKQYEICEAYLKWTPNEEEEPVEIIVTFEKSSMVILRAIYNFYHAYKRPFVAHQYETVLGSIFGVPLTFILEPLHVARSASVNQRLDAASLAISKVVIVPPGSDLKNLDVGVWRGTFLEGSIKKDELHDISLENKFTQLPELEAQLEREADKLAGLSDYSFGQEQIDRPTATGQIQIIEESKQPQYIMLERFRVALAEVSKHCLARYRQFYPEGLQFYTMQEDPEGIQLVEQFFQWPDGAIERDVIIETKVSSSSMSKQLRKQELTALLDKLIPYFDKLMQMAQVATDPMNPSAIIAAKLMNGLYVAMDNMLTEFEVGKKDTLNPELINEIEVYKQIQQAMQQMQQQIAQLGNQNQQLQAANAQLQAGAGQGQPMAGPPGPPPGVQGPMPMGAGPQGQGGAPSPVQQ